MRAERAELMAGLLGAERDAPASNRLLFCTDANYLIGVCIALSSLFRNNIGAASRYEVMIFCADDVMGLAREVIGKIAVSFGASIIVRSSAELAVDGAALRTDYGHFGPGHSLPGAVYHRIFATDLMMREGAKGRLLYLDADILVDWDLDSLLNFDLKGAPLAARLEDTGAPAVRRATRKLGVEPGKYFNSGVMLFDLDHPGLSAGLARAMDAALNAQEMLTFQDQCALNLAFRDRFAELPEAFNFFVRTKTDLEAVENSPKRPVVWHYLDRPKPWDPEYATGNCVSWLREFAVLATVLSTAQLRRLMLESSSSTKPASNKNGDSSVTAVTAN